MFFVYACMHASLLVYVFIYALLLSFDHMLQGLQLQLPFVLAYGAEAF